MGFEPMMAEDVSAPMQLLHTDAGDRSLRRHRCDTQQAVDNRRGQQMGEPPFVSKRRGSVELVERPHASAAEFVDQPPGHGNRPMW